MKYTPEELAAQAEELRKNKLIKGVQALESGKAVIINPAVNIEELEEIAADFEKDWKLALAQSKDCEESHKKLEEIAKEFEDKYNQQRNAKKAALQDLAECVMERDRLQDHLSIYKTDLANARSENKTLRDIGTSLEQSIVELEATIPSALDTEMSNAILTDLKKEAEIQSAKAMAGEVKLIAWREWAKTFPKE